MQDIDSDGPEPSDWDKYASEEYEILVAEETANEQLHEGYDTHTHACICRHYAHLTLDCFYNMSCICKANFDKCNNVCCCVSRSFDDDYETEELQVSGEIGNKMEKLVISDLTA